MKTQEKEIKKFDFIKMSPGGNTTILIENPPVCGHRERARLANILMSQLHLHAEQVGYVSFLNEYPRLDMMGGEFCGNASRSLAALLAIDNHKSLKEVDGNLVGKILVSGVKKPLNVIVKKDNNVINSFVQMPIESDVGSTVTLYLDREKPVFRVRMEGITHILIDEEQIRFPLSGYESYTEHIRKNLGLTDLDAVGCIWYKEVEGEFEIKPVVWVKATNSTYYETACGSGTIALGLMRAYKEKNNVSGQVKQPSGEKISFKVDYDPEKNIFLDAWIGGNVDVIARGETFISE